MDYREAWANGEIEAGTLVDRLEEQAREIERLQIMSDNYCALLMDANQEIAALKSQPSGVVQWPDADEIMQMAFEEGQPSEDASGYYFELEEFDLFIQRLMEEVARLNQPASAALSANHSEQVREGWKLVPVKPSIDMVEAGYEASLGCPDRGSYARVIEQYDAMLAAIPSPASQGGDV